ncbi:MAG: NADPH-dependent 7-cyano-7-deazaguanine reductase QueF [Verrucomicrobiae bacterium]|nr:NADPH-dependent 7-cyano-7-deazaguanine reductase QueF [Verrucomicrobiae bacterium]
MNESEERPNLTLLGRSESRLPASPDDAKLEIFPNRNPERDYWITLDCPEFTSLCPVTGQPDFAKLQIRYIPDASCVETKSLKFYLASFRNRPSFNEEVVNRILTDLVAATDPRHMIVTGQFGSRGGIALSVEAEHVK